VMSLAQRGCVASQLTKFSVCVEGYRKHMTGSGRLLRNAQCSVSALSSCPISNVPQRIFSSGFRTLPQPRGCRGWMTGNSGHILHVPSTPPSTIHLIPTRACLTILWLTVHKHPLGMVMAMAWLCELRK